MKMKNSAMMTVQIALTHALKVLSDPEYKYDGITALRKLKVFVQFYRNNDSQGGMTSYNAKSADSSQQQLIQSLSEMMSLELMTQDIAVNTISSFMESLTIKLKADMKYGLTKPQQLLSMADKKRYLKRSDNKLSALSLQLMKRVKFNHVNTEKLVDVTSLLDIIIRCSTVLTMGHIVTEDDHRVMDWLFHMEERGAIDIAELIVLTTIFKGDAHSHPNVFSLLLVELDELRTITAVTPEQEETMLKVTLHFIMNRPTAAINWSDLKDIVMNPGSSHLPISIIAHMVHQEQTTEEAIPQHIRYTLTPELVQNFTSQKQ